VRVGGKGSLVVKKARMKLVENKSVGETLRGKQVHGENRDNCGRAEENVRLGNKTGGGGNWSFVL